MALIAEKIATEILGKLISFSEEEIIRIWNVKEEFEKLKETFPMLLAVLTDAEKRQEKEGLVRLWLKRLKDVAYEADDVLDEFSFEAMRMKIEKSKMKKVSGFLSRKNPIKFRSSMARKIEDINKKMESIRKDMDMFKFIVGDGNDHSKNDLGRKTFPGIGDLNILGRENEKSQLLDMLIGKSSNEGTLSVIPIVGIGGLGKTTLAKLVYNHDSVVAHFEKRMWLCVSDNFEVIRLIQEIVQSLTGVNLQLSSPEAIQSKLDENLRGKKFLLVLDDVWNRDHQKWEELKALLAIGAKGSKIIVTTRDVRVASIMKTTQSSHLLEGLSEEDSWSLFKRRAFAMGGQTTNKEKIGRELVKKCKGVPLAIQSLGALMYLKTTDHEWLSVKYSDIWDSEDEHGISSVLKLSYHDLPPPLKRCFIYCSIFPKDYTIRKKTLIQLWMAEGLLHSSNDGKLMEDVGDDYFDSLVWISFLQDVERNKLGEAKTCKMHDLVHDLGQNIVGNECIIMEDFNENKPNEETRYLSTVGFRKRTIPGLNMEKLRAYLYLGGSNLFDNPIHNSTKMFSNFRNLRILDLHDAWIKSLPSSMEELKHLRYLNLSGNRFAKLPESITNLYNLQTLKMTSFVPRVLPEGITKMINLRHLEFDNGLVVPKGIGQLTNLQTLSYFRASKGTKAAGIEELGDLRQLGGTLKLYNLNWRMIKNATAANLKQKPGLRELHLIFGQHSSEYANELLESLQPHPSLISLSIVCFEGTELPSWLVGKSPLSFLVCLSLTRCPNLRSLNLASLSSLRLLEIDDCPILSSVLLKGLTALEKIEVTDCEKLMFLGVPEDDGMPDFNRLNTLTIRRCSSFATLPFYGVFSHLTALNTSEVGNCSTLMTLRESLGNLPPLRVLNIVCCSGLLALPNSFGNLSSLQELTIDWCKHLATLPDSFGNLSSLQELTIRGCENLATLPDSFGNLSSLQELTIDRCQHLATLPDSFGNLSSLQKLRISGCQHLATLPDSFGNLSSLQVLRISGCQHLVTLPADSFATLPDSFGNLSSLQELRISGCQHLATLPESFGNLSSLQELMVDRCQHLAILPDSFGNLSSLQELTIDRCQHLATLPDSFGNLSSLQELSIRGCGSLVALPESLRKLSSLERFFVITCNALTTLSESLGDLSSLKKLEILDCPNLASLSERICGLTSLSRLYIRGLENLEALPDSLRTLSSLESLLIEDCPSLMSLPDCFEGLTSLSSVTVHLANLRALPESLGKLSSLYFLSINGCKNLKSLPKGIQNLTSLRSLTMRDCPQLKKRYRRRKFQGLPRIISHIPKVYMDR